MNAKTISCTYISTNYMYFAQVLNNEMTIQFQERASSGRAHCPNT